MIRFYYNTAPNPMKVALFLEESGLPYEPIPVDTRKGEQFDPAFAALNPNNKVPCIVDDGVTVFDSNAILLYLAEKTGQFLPEDTLEARGRFLSWLMFVATGIGPYSGQAVHFRHYAPEPKDYANTRYEFEAKRHYGILNTHLSKNRFMLGDTYTIVDMAVWGWARLVPFMLADEGVWDTLPHLKRMLDTITERPAAQRALGLKDLHQFKTENDAETQRHFFRFREPIV
ncbi:MULTISPECIES: glutathione S-transferase family protein [unclassified Acidisoma]|jgi:GST-like protein|uniref:glutathione S-transferase family protein n=1 Tax=unclassified Acidisoma TaxID=2634065 RepID=UPI00131BBCB8|nr:MULTISPECIES: glutathione S-transferase N-terminal domain-containing protein [unclassified Acidisoma]